MHETTVTSSEETAPHIRGAFAELGVRVFALGVDVFIIFFAIAASAEHILGIPELDKFVFRTATVLIAPAYFTLFWASPLRATPAQLLFGMRVVDKSGARLSIARAALRAATLVALYALFFVGFWSPTNPLLQLALIVGIVFVFLAALTPNRQAIHDWFASSIVVNRKALASDARRRDLLEHVADVEPGSWSRRRPSIPRILLDAVVLAIPLFIVQTATSVAIDKNMRSRVSYAIGETQGLRYELEFYRELEGDWPHTRADLVFETSGKYPAGGHYRLEPDGVVRIQFEVRPELRDGSIELYPTTIGGVVEWHCRVTGSLEERYLPSMCRS